MNDQRNSMRYSGSANGGQNAHRVGGCGCGNGACGGCGCARGDRDGGPVALDCLSGMSLAMVYSPCQEFEDLYDHTEGLKRGTIFRALDLPFSGKGGKCNG